MSKYSYDASLRTALRIRLIAILLTTTLISGTVAAVVTQMFNQNALDKAVEREKTLITQRIDDFQSDLEIQATKLVSILEFANVLQGSDPKNISARFTAFLTSIGVASSFDHVLLISEEGQFLAGYPRHAVEPTKFAAANDKNPDWKFDADEGAVYRSLIRPVLVAGKPGKLLLYAPLDAAQLSKFGSAGTFVTLNWLGAQVAKNNTAQSNLKRNVKLLSFGFPLNQDKTAGAEVVGEIDFAASLKPINSAVIVMIALLMMQIMAWVILGRWLSINLLRLDALGRALVLFGKSSSRSSEIDHCFGLAARGKSDEISDLCLSAESLIVEIEKGKSTINQLAAIVENATEAIFSRDMEGKIQTWNESAERIFGYSSTEVIGQHIWTYMPSSTPAVLKENNELLLRGEKISLVELELINKYDQRLTVLGSLSPIKNSHGIVTSVACLIQDVTERKALERSRVQLQIKLQNAQRAQAVSDLAGSFAHHFNNMLGIILGNIDLALESMDDKEKLLARLKRTEILANRAADLVHQLMNFAQIVPTQRSPVDLARLVTATTGLFRAKLSPHCNLEVHCEAKPIVLADPKQIEQVLINLLQNAVEALDSETGNICIRIGSVKIDADLPTSPVGAVEQIGEQLPVGTCAGRITISDTGRGIDRQVIANIWEPFYTTKKITLGSGLGLSVVLGIVKSHGGNILLESESGRGTTFSVFLPLHETSNCQM